ncbi:MAG: ArnT family glycosyltransferase [Kiritimatiellia bacterium]
MTRINLKLTYCLRRNPGFKVTWIGLLFLGVAMRVWGAWLFEYTHTSDHGIACLMAKHILEGREYPIFFYGQGYLGSIEPFIAAGLCSLFRLNGFWINMAPAVLGCAVLPLVYIWARGAAGRWAGLIAMALCTIGSSYLFQYLSWTNGGYAAIILLTPLVSVLALLTLDRELRGKRTGFLLYLALGVAAGLGWWQSFLVVPAILTAVLLSVVVLRMKLFSWRPIAALTGFTLGSAPFWIWNMRNGWQTFTMLGSKTRPGVTAGLRILYGERVPVVLGLDSWRSSIGLSIAFLLLLPFLAAVVAGVRNWCLGRWRRTLWLGAAFVFVTTFSLLFGCSQYASIKAPRYALPLYPVLAVIVGSGSASLGRLIGRRTPRLAWLCAVPTAAVVTLHGVRLPAALGQRKLGERMLEHAVALADFFRSHDIQHLYTDYQVRGVNHALNFLLNEEFVFSPPTRERYRPYAEAMELAVRPAVLNNSQDFQAFLKLAGGSASTARVGRTVIHYDACPPPDNWRPADPSCWQAITAENGINVLEGLTDQRADTGWSVQGTAPAPIILELRPRRSVELVGLRLLCDEENYPSRVAVELWDENSTSWKLLIPEMGITSYFWSGPRFYFGGDAYRLELRFPPVRTDCLRLTLRRGRARQRVGFVEVQALETHDEPAYPPACGEIEPVIAILRERGVRRVYADRWESGVFHFVMNSDLRVIHLPHLNREHSLTRTMSLDRTTAIVVRTREAHMTRNALRARGISTHEIEIGRWVVFDFANSNTPLQLLMNPGLEWWGFGCLIAENHTDFAVKDRSARNEAE